MANVSISQEATSFS